MNQQENHEDNIKTESLTDLPLAKETTVMDQKDEQEPNNQQSMIEDLTVNEDRAAEVKAGEGRYQYAFAGTYQNAAYNGRSE